MGVSKTLTTIRRIWSKSENKRKESNGIVSIVSTGVLRIQVWHIYRWTQGFIFTLQQWDQAGLRSETGKGLVHKGPRYKSAESHSNPPG